MLAHVHGHGLECESCAPHPPKTGLAACFFSLQGVSIWYEQGLQATASDFSPISGLVATCSGADNVTTELAVSGPVGGEGEVVVRWHAALRLARACYGASTPTCEPTAMPSACSPCRSCPARGSPNPARASPAA